jgi:trehalose-6-phosphate synthase/HAMP domain-containing protein
VKRLLMLLLPILIVVAAGFTVLGIVQVRSVRERLLDDLMRKARAVAESTEFSAREILRTGDRKEAGRLAESFQRREWLQGCIIYDRAGKVIAITERIAALGKSDAVFLKLVLDTRAGRGVLEQTGEYPVYRYVQPVLDEDGSPLGLVEVVYDTSYLYSTLAGLWRRISFTLIGLVSLIVIVALVVERQTYVLPIRRITTWFRYFQKGDIDHLTPFPAKGELGRLVTEVEQVALSLRVARRAVADEAQQRLAKEDLWTEPKLRDLVNAKLGEHSLFVVSNREPCIHTVDEASGRVRVLRPASGVVTAIDPILRACGGMWIAHGSGNADRRFVNSKNKLGVPPGEDRYILKRVWLTKDEEEGYYYGFSNEGLWPLCHVTHTRPVFRESDWRMYEKVNRIFAESVLEELPAKSPFVFIQDYHFTLLPRLIKEKRPDATIALFWHIPWPNPEVFAICPYQHEILQGMLGCDLIGFHVQVHCNNFLDTVNRLLEARVDAERFSVVQGKKETSVRAFPISVAASPDGGDGRALEREVKRIRAEHGLDGKIVAVGVDRVDYTKGIAERILAIDRLLEQYPEYIGRFVFIQIGAPSRTHIKRYHDLAAEIDELIQTRNWKYSTESWRPIIYINRQLSPEEIKPYYELADLCIVSSLHDGMNLVAKEYIASKRGDGGMLLLSRFTGAARELADAVLINPYSIGEFADAIRYAIEMKPEERRSRMESMWNVVSENNVYRWAASIITELTSLKKGETSPAEVEAPPR